MSWSYVGSASVPTDNGTNAGSTNSGVITITPPGSMSAGDLVWVRCHQRYDLADFTNTRDGGQTWTAEADSDRASNNASKVFWCVYDGTWDNDPQFTTDEASDAGPFTAVMHVFRHDGGGTPTQDVAQSVANGAGPGSVPGTVTVAGGMTTTVDDVLAIGSLSTLAAATYAVFTAGWTEAGTSQYRNATGAGSSMTTIYKVQVSAGSTGGAQTTQDGSTGANCRAWQAWKPVGGSGGGSGGRLVGGVLLGKALMGGVLVG